MNMQRNNLKIVTTFKYVGSTMAGYGELRC